MPLSRVGLVAAILLLAPAVAGCLDAPAAKDEVGGPGFDIRASDVYHSYWSNGDEWTDEIPWKNPSGRARLEVRHELEEGAQRVSILDANGTRVFLQEWWPGTRGGEFHVDDGAPGEWTVVIERRGSVGQFDVHVWRGEAPADA